MTSSPPPPYSTVEDASDETIVPAKSSTAPSSSTQAVTNPHKESVVSVDSNTVTNTPLPCSTAPSTPLPIQQEQQQQQQTVPMLTQTAHVPPINGVAGQVGGPTMNNVAGQVGGPTMNGITGQVAGAPCMTSPPFTTHGVGTAAMPGMPAYPATIPMQPMCTQPPAMGMSPQMAGMGTNPVQNGGINLVVNTNANSNTNSNNAGGGTGALPRPALRPCPKCRLGYITRGQARFREMGIKALAYGTICFTFLLPLKLLETNYVDKCSYCGEEYGFRGELFEKPKPVKIRR
ncbi:hypothetical protein KIN20_010552 [Parelaphostrongylus tenuis]|uniref:LITAF domain-containing protein n=1 Tax=Parelaphostrongylus tenuis TaxID=148309 RepID=A0AAD5MTJ4_PARTN|nr:hypothetical protein KIN20_010552 [Parelaphostrongylus tenuis]